MPVPTNTSGQAAAAAPPDRRQPWQGNPDTTPAVVLRSHYRQLHALLAIAMIAVVGLAAVVILATNDDRDTTRYDGGPEEGTRAPAATPSPREDANGPRSRVPIRYATSAAEQARTTRGRPRHTSASRRRAGSPLVRGTLSQRTTRRSAAHRQAECRSPMGAVAPPLAQSWASRSDCLGALSGEPGDWAPACSRSPTIASGEIWAVAGKRPGRPAAGAATLVLRVGRPFDQK
jgi:hypothetical protein